MEKLEIHKEPREDVARNRLQRYAAEKRLQFLLAKKFEMMEKLHPLLLGEPEEISNRYWKMLNVINSTIQTEIKYLNQKKEG